MELKKGVILLNLVLFFSVLILNLSQADTLVDLGNAQEQINTYSDTTYWGDKWNYLGHEWQTLFLRNSMVASINSFFESISIVFTILFGMPYELSLVLFGIIFLWILFFNMIYNWIKYSGILAKTNALLLALAFTVGLAQIGFFRAIVVLIGRLILSPEGAWARTILLIGIIVIIILVQYMSNFFSKYLKAKKEADEKYLEKLNRTILGKFVKNFEEMSK